VPKTILLALLIGGAIFLVCAWITQSRCLGLQRGVAGEQRAAGDRLQRRWPTVQDPAHLSGFRRHGGVQPRLARVGLADALRDGAQRPWSG
jgi:hypothetical protein